MHIPTHMLSGWVGSNLFRPTPRQRALCGRRSSAGNIDAAAALLAMTMGIALDAGRTPVEALMPRLDARSWPCCAAGVRSARVPRDEQGLHPLRCLPIVKQP